MNERRVPIPVGDLANAPVGLPDCPLPRRLQKIKGLLLSLSIKRKQIFRFLPISQAFTFEILLSCRNFFILSAIDMPLPYNFLFFTSMFGGFPPSRLRLKLFVTLPGGIKSTPLETNFIEPSGRAIK